MFVRINDMATQLSTIEFLTEQLTGAGDISYKKMFGEYMIYINRKPVFLICDDTLFVKILPETDNLMGGKAVGFPYNGAKPHYIVEDVDDREFLCALAKALEAVTPLPKPRKNKDRGV